MLVRSGAIAAAALALFVGVGTAKAQDTLRLGLTRPVGLPSGFNVQADTQTLAGADADTLEVWGWRCRPWVGYYGCYRPWVGYYGGYYGCYRPWVGYYGGYCAPYVYSYYSPPVYYYYYSAPCYTPYVYFSISGGVDALVSNALLNGSPAIGNGRPTAQPFSMPSLKPQAPATPPSPPLSAIPPGGTFQYDGGPANPVPMPRSDPKPDSKPTTVPAVPTVPFEGRPVSLPAPVRPVRLAYPAYGDR